MKQQATLIQRSFTVLFVGCWVFVAISPVLPAGGEEPPVRPPPALSARDSLREMEVAPNLRVELVASEPLVVDPISIAFGADGKLWVVEMGDYPTHRPESRGTGRIRFLEDRDGDGTYERSRLFLEGLKHPTSVFPWRDGLLIAAAPQILFAEDTNGDGRADRQRVVFRGFKTGNPQHQVNDFRWGLDNWIHIANGDVGGVVVSESSGEEQDIHGHDFRIDRHLTRLELESGMSQFGRCRDDWGNWFGGNNTTPAWHCPLPDRYLQRNQFWAPPDPRVPLTYPPTSPLVFPRSKPLPRFNEFGLAGRITSACGPCIYRDELLGGSIANNLFVCEPAHNLVHREVLHHEGASFYSERAEDEQRREFLASGDAWFRPTQVRTGPDGALWVVDMYRLIIEHPQFFDANNNEKQIAKWPLRAGADKGRIYRVVNARLSMRKRLDLTSFDWRQLTAAMDSPNGPQRDLAQQLLVERNEQLAIPGLAKLARESDDPKRRLQALCTLEGLGALRRDAVQAALEDDHAAVRRHAVRLSERHLSCPRILTQVCRLASDEDSQVRLQVALSLGETADIAAGQALAAICERDLDDPHIVAAIRSSESRHGDAVIRRLIRQRRKTPMEADRLIGAMLGSAVANERQLLVVVLNELTRADLPFERSLRLAAQVCDAVEANGGTLSEFTGRAEKPLRASLLASAPLFRKAQRIAEDDRAATELRVAAIRLAGRGPIEKKLSADLFRKLLDPRGSLDVQLAGVAALAASRRKDVAELLLENWSGYGPQLRQRIVDLLLSRKSWCLQLLDAIEQGDAQVNQIGERGRSQLLLHYYAEVRRRATVVVKSPPSKDRRQTIDHFRGATSRTGEPRRGAMLFRKHCANCHAHDDEPRAGPPLRSFSDQSTEKLLTAILDPSRSIDPRYTNYTVLTEGGRVFSGVIAHESGPAIRLVDANGAAHDLLRSDLEDIQAAAKSFMPDGMERSIASLQEMADLLALLRHKNAARLVADAPETID